MLSIKTFDYACTNQKFFFPPVRWGLLDFMSAVPAASFSSPASSPGPQIQALDRSVPRRTRAASSGSECFPARFQLQAQGPDFNCKR